MITAGQKRGPRRTAQRGCVKTIVPQTLRCELVHRRRGHPAAECAELSEARIVNQNKDHVWRSLGRLNRLRKLRRVGIFVGTPDVAGEVEVRARKYNWRPWRRSW